MKFTLACLLVSVSSCVVFASARPSRLKDETSKIEVGPDETVDPTDAVDKPLVRPIVTTSDAPHGPASVESDETHSVVSTESRTPDIDAPAKEPASTHAPASVGKPKVIVTPSAPATEAPVREEKLKSEAAKSESAKPVIEGVTAEQSQLWLENGNARFVSKNFRADGKTEGDRARIAKDQKPHAIVLSCSDSRVPPELIFDQALGEITTIRVAGEVPDASVIASIEQTILKQHPHLLVVLGHTQCESVETAIGWKDAASAGSDSLDRMVAEIKPHLKTMAQSARSAGLATEAALQADGVARDLSDRSEIIKKAVDSGDLTIKSGLYWLDTGKVKFY